MKRFTAILLVACVLILCSNALAVNLAGKFALTGRLTINMPILNFADDKKTGGQMGYGFGVNGEYFVADYIALGTRFDYNRFRVKSGDANYEVYFKVTSFGAFIKYVILTKSELRLYLKLDLGLYKPRVCAESDYTQEISYSTKFGFAFGGGVFRASKFSMAGIEVLFHNAFVKDAKTTYMGDEYNFGRDLEYIQLSVVVAFFIGGR